MTSIRILCLSFVRKVLYYSPLFDCLKKTTVLPDIYHIAAAQLQRINHRQSYIGARSASARGVNQSAAHKRNRNEMQGKGDEYNERK